MKADQGQRGRRGIEGVKGGCGKKIANVTWHECCDQMSQSLFNFNLEFQRISTVNLSHFKRFHTFCVLEKQKNTYIHIPQVQLKQKTVHKETSLFVFTQPFFVCFIWVFPKIMENPPKSSICS